MLYVVVSLVLTGIVNYTELNSAAPLADALEAVGYDWIASLVSLGALAGLTTVILILMMGQSRVLFAMSRDRLLPGRLATVHPRYGTPWLISLITGVVVALIATFVPLSTLADMVNIGTLFAFVLVSGGVLLLDGGARKSGRYVPYLDSRWIVPGLYLGVWAWALFLPSASANGGRPPAISPRR